MSKAQQIKQQIAELQGMMKEAHFNRKGGTPGAYNPDRWAHSDWNAGKDDEREFRNRERNAGLEHETNNLQISINGKPWKVIPGRGYADSHEEWSYVQAMKKWADKKSAATGKKWEVYLTGAPVSESLAEWKKSTKAPIRPRNFVAKNAVQSGAGAHKDKKKDAKQGKEKHKKKPELAESLYSRRLNVLLESKVLTEKIRAHRNK